MTILAVKVLSRCQVEVLAVGYDQVLGEARAIMASGDFDAAQRAEVLLLSFAESAPTTTDKGRALRDAAICASQAGKVPAAMEYFEEAETLLTEAVDLLALYECWATMAYQAKRREVVPKVSKALASALEACDAVYTTVLPFAYGALARLQVMSGDVHRAVATAEKAVTVAQLYSAGQPESFSALSVAREAQGDEEGAMEAMEEAMVHTSDTKCLMEAHADLSRLAMRLGDTTTASRHLRAAVEFPDLRDRLVLAKVQHTIAGIVRVDPDSAVALLERLASFLENSAGTTGVAR